MEPGFRIAALVLAVLAAGAGAACTGPVGGAHAAVANPGVAASPGATSASSRCGGAYDPATGSNFVSCAPPGGRSLRHYPRGGHR